MENTPKGSNQKACEEWIQWLTNYNSDRAAIFNNFFKAIKSFVVIPVTSCSCERSFSKLSKIKIVKHNGAKSVRWTSDYVHRTRYGLYYRCR